MERLHAGTPPPPLGLWEEPTIGVLAVALAFPLTPTSRDQSLQAPVPGSPSSQIHLSHLLPRILGTVHIAVAPGRRLSQIQKNAYVGIVNESTVPILGAYCRLPWGSSSVNAGSGPYGTA